MFFKMKVYLCIVVLILGAAFSGFKKEEEIALLEEIIQLSERSTTVNVIKASFTIKKEEELNIYYLLEGLQLDSETKINEVRDFNHMCIEFRNSYLQGSIEAIREGNLYTVAVFTKSSYGKSLQEFRAILDSALKNRGDIITYSYYMKAKIQEGDLLDINKRISKRVASLGAEGIDTIKISNGYSTVDYTKKFERIQNNGRYMDINYALVSYSSGSYIVIGKPIIIRAY